MGGRTVIERRSSTQPSNNRAIFRLLIGWVCSLAGLGYRKSYQRTAPPLESMRCMFSARRIVMSRSRIDENTVEQTMRSKGALAESNCEASPTVKEYLG